MYSHRDLHSRPRTFRSSFELEERKHPRRDIFSLDLIALTKIFFDMIPREISVQIEVNQMKSIFEKKKEMIICIGKKESNAATINS